MPDPSIRYPIKPVLPANDLRLLHNPPPPLHLPLAPPPCPHTATQPPTAPVLDLTSCYTPPAIHVARHSYRVSPLPSEGSDTSISRAGSGLALARTRSVIAGRFAAEWPTAPAATITFSRSVHRVYGFIPKKTLRVHRVRL